MPCGAPSPFPLILRDRNGNAVDRTKEERGELLTRIDAALKEAGG